MAETAGVAHRVPTAAICAWLLTASAGAVEDRSFEERVARAARLNVTAPWQESQAIIDNLKQDLHEATPGQKAEVRLLEARNLALAGKHQAAIDLLEPLRQSEDAAAKHRLRALRLSANIAIEQDALESGVRFMQEGLRLIPRVDAPAPKTKLLSLAAYYHSQAGEGKRGIGYAKDALSLARSANNERLICVALNDLALAQRRAGNDGAALTTQQRAVKVCDAAADPVYKGVSRNALAAILTDRGDFSQAIDLAKRGLAASEKASYRDGILNGRFQLGRALIAVGRAKEGRALLQPLVEKFEKRGYWHQLSQVHRELGDLDASRGAYSNALQHFKDAESANRKFLNRERAMRLAHLQVQFDTRRKEQEIDLLRQRNRVLELQEQTQRQRQLIAYGGIAMLSAIGGLLFLLLLKTRSDRRRLLRLSQRDSLTGLYNHTNFFRQAGKALHSSQKNGSSFTLVLADIDYFKLINDHHGHTAGDNALREIGRQLQTRFEPDGIVGRIGGEEFAVALPGVHAAQAQERIALINRRLRPVTAEDMPIELTLSYGLAEAGEHEALEDLRQRADTALYQAKRSGRACTVAAAELAS